VISGKVMNLGGKSHVPTMKILNSGSRKVRDFMDVWNTQSNTTDGLPAGR